MTRSECGFTVMWSCYCTDAAYDLAELAERCPHHDRPRVAEPVNLDDHGRTGGVTTGHQCPLLIDLPTPDPRPEHESNEE